MARICHTNKCPVGVATQQEALRKRFPGIPDHVVNFFLFVAEEVRQLMSLIGVTKLEDLIGRSDLLEARQINLIKTNKIDLSCLLKNHQIHTNRSWLNHEIEAHSNGETLEDLLLEDKNLLNAINNQSYFSKETNIVNTDRSVCARISGEIAERYGNKGFKGEIKVTFNGAAGQSFGAFLIQGMQILLIGEANDYVGKGMNGGEMIIKPKLINKKSGDQVILGNTCLYGGTGGELYALGRAGERFAVRNSGVNAVVEGTGDHCCEYMTGGVIVVLGSTGRNVGAGMTGGIAFILDEKNDLIRKVNNEIVCIYELSTKEQEEILKPLLEKHLEKTNSHKTNLILQNWNSSKNLFKVIVPPSEKEKVGLEHVQKALV
tara:strand:- start:853 stop:1977 length:1125 start_codon:yes stop_codon:yes gene_type:complete